MARLIDWPVGLGIRSWEPSSGPESVNSGSNASTNGVPQTFASPLGGWGYSVTLPACQGRMARRLRGMITALHAGANAVRLAWHDADGMSLEEAGISYSVEQMRDGIPWANDEPWANGENWAAQYPLVTVGVAAAKGATIITLSDSFWGSQLDMGDEFGFVGHFAKYQVTQRIAAGQYRIWPQLRRAVTTNDLATLVPVLAMRPFSTSFASYSRDVDVMPETVLQLFEVYDYDVRAHFMD
ncbi:hypothetical protein ACQZ61_04075 [Agrobacterium vitis]|uniref:hypothetical protein n=1 Tax=Agrobacterium vitis TaxID=373 RepID=UPI001F34EDAD|nr:hypothetical protein [Agrobacterium vitis]MCF1452299.1 hypothetical protein [Agrobacterium vitis]